LAVVADALALGIDGVFAQSSGDELAALADAARYTHRPDIARGAFLAQRRRFPGSEHARVAAFGLGRLEDADQDPRVALGWFDTYLGEAPNGRYASEALGRKMTLVKVLDGQEAARAWADLYLRRFPSGTYAAAARAVTGVP
jgi:TolA-binding protein